MAFHVYPDPQTNPLNVGTGAGNTSPLVSIVELAGIDPVTSLNTMFIRVVMIGTACVPSGAANPTVILKADSGDEVDIPIGSTIPIHNLPGGTGTEVANAIMSAEDDDVYLVRVFIFSAGSSWQIRIRNNDAVSAHDFTWVVADNDDDSKQPWIDIPDELPMPLETLTNQVIPIVIEVTNKGTRPLTINDTPPLSLGSGFSLQAVPGAIDPNACGNLELEFDASDSPGESSTTYTVDSDDDTAVVDDATAAHNKKVTLTATTGRLEAIMVLDASGSMAYTPGGTDPASATDSRWSKMTEAAGQFLDLLEDFAVGLGRVGIIIFPDITGADYPPAPADASSALLQEAIAISDDVGPIKELLLGVDAPAPVARQGTPTTMGHGIAKAMGETTGSFGQFEDDTNEVSFNRRWMVLMSDGVHTLGPPDPPDFYGDETDLTSFRGKKVKVFAVSYGDPGALNWPPNQVLMQTIATESDGQYEDAGADDAGFGLKKQFRGAIVTGLSLDPTSDPGGILTGEFSEVRRQVNIIQYDMKVSFIVNWSTYNEERVDVQLLTPNCELITPSTENPNIKFHSHPRYKIYTVNEDYLRNASDPENSRYGEWTLIIIGHGLGGDDVGSNREPFEYEVITESRLKLNLTLDKRGYFAGDKIGLTARITLDGKPIRNAAVTLRLAGPGLHFDNFVASTRVTDDEMKRARESLGKETDLTAVGIKALAIKLKGQPFGTLPRRRTISMTDPDSEGVYRATIGNTQVPGTYDLHVTAMGQTEDGTTLFRREKGLSARVSVRPDPIFTPIDIGYRKVFVDDRPFFVADVRVIPRDRFGNVILIDPEFDPTIAVTAEGGEFIGPLTGNLDGSYTRSIRYTPETNLIVGLKVDREEIIPRFESAPIGKSRFVDEVADFKLGNEAEKGANKHRDPKKALGDFTAKEVPEFVSLGGFGSLTVGIHGHIITAHEDDDIIVFVHPDEEMRPYVVEGLPAVGKSNWVALGTSIGITQSFGLRGAGLKAAREIRISDKSGRTRTDELEVSNTPGVSILGVGVKKTSLLPGDREGCLNFLYKLITWLRGKSK